MGTRSFDGDSPLVKSVLQTMLIFHFPRVITCTHLVGQQEQEEGEKPEKIKKYKFIASASVVFQVPSLRTNKHRRGCLKDEKMVTPEEQLLMKETIFCFVHRIPSSSNYIPCGVSKLSRVGELTKRRCITRTCQ